MPRRGALFAHTEISTNSVILALREVGDALPYNEKVNFGYKKPQCVEHCGEFFLLSYYIPIRSKSIPIYDLSISMMAFAKFTG